MPAHQADKRQRGNSTKLLHGDADRLPRAAHVAAAVAVLLPRIFASAKTFARLNRSTI